MVCPRRALMTEVQHWAKTAKTDHVTLTYDLWGYGASGWCRLSSSIRIPSLKFIGLAVRKVRRTMCVSINGHRDLDLWPFDLETGLRVASEVGNLSSKFEHARPLGSQLIRYVRGGRTDGRTKATLIAPYLMGGDIKIKKFCLQFYAIRAEKLCND